MRHYVEYSGEREKSNRPVTGLTVRSASRNSGHGMRLVSSNGRWTDPAESTYFPYEPESLVPEDAAHRGHVLAKQAARRQWVLECLRDGRARGIRYQELVMAAFDAFTEPPCCTQIRCGTIRAVLAVRQLTWHGLADIDERGRVYLVPPLRGEVAS